MKLVAIGTRQRFLIILKDQISNKCIDFYCNAYYNRIRNETIDIQMHIWNQTIEQI